MEKFSAERKKGLMYLPQELWDNVLQRLQVMNRRDAFCRARALLEETFIVPLTLRPYSNLATLTAKDHYFRGQKLTALGITRTRISGRFYLNTAMNCLTLHMVLC